MNVLDITIYALIIFIIIGMGIKFFFDLKNKIKESMGKQK